MSSQVWWFVARSSGIIAWALLSLGVCWGLWLSTQVASARLGRAQRRSTRTVRPTPAWVLALHRHLGGLAVIFTAIHLVGLVADSYVHFGWAEILIPMASEWEPGAVAFGIVGFYLLLAIEATSLAMRHLPRHVWRWIHRSSFVLYATATYHGIAAGTDADNRWFALAAWASVVAVVALTLRWLLVLRRVERVGATAVAEARPPLVASSPATLPAPTAAAVPATATAWAPPPGGMAPASPPPPLSPSPPPSVVPVPAVAAATVASASASSASPAPPPPPPPPAPAPAPRPTVGPMPAPGHPQRSPLVPSGVAATPPLSEVPMPSEFADDELVNAGGGAEGSPEHPTVAT